MRDIFGQEVTEAQLVEWDMIIARYYTGPQISQVADAQPPADDRFWREELTIPQEQLLGLSVLELGCGTGRCAASLHWAGANYTGLDRSRIAVQVARGRFRDCRDVAFAHTVWEAGFAQAWTGAFDLIFTTFFFIHQRPEMRGTVLNCAARWLRPGGVLSLDFWPKSGPAPRVGDDWPVYPIGPDELRSLGGQYGLLLASVEEHHLEGRRGNAIFQRSLDGGYHG